MDSLSFVLIAFVNILRFVTAENTATCYPVLDCDVDPEEMRAAIELIPDPATNTGNSHPDAESYRVPAIFEASPEAQILVRVIASSGIVLDGDGLMTHLWPHAKELALYVYKECNMDSSNVSGLSGLQIATLQWDGPPARQLEFQVDLTCDIDKTSHLGVTTYTTSGIQSGSRIGEGRNHSEAGGFGTEWV